MNEAVKLIECPRDAWQGLARQIPTELKARYLRELIAAGVKHIDAVSFVSPKAVPQMSDSEEVLAQLSPPPDVEIIGIVVNEKGAERAIQTGAVTTLGYPCSISETFLRRNQNQSSDENIATLQSIAKRANDAGLGTIAYISMAFGNPYGDEWSERRVTDAAREIIGLGVRTISLADTAGIADALLVRALVTAVLKECGTCELGVHLHSTTGDAVAKVLAAYDAGCRRFDAALGGLGGCPFAQDELVGNIATEAVFSALEQRGIKLEQNLDRAIAINDEIAREFSR